jgi:kynurenine 3-monooxygenase
VSAHLSGRRAALRSFWRLDNDLQWKPELDAVSWISEKMLFENRLHTLRANLTMKAGINVIGQAKSSQKSYAQVRADARRYGPLWS